MSIHVALNHLTHYRYDRRVGLGPQIVRLRPAPHCRTRILSYSLRVEPAKHFVNWQQDAQSNHLARLVFPEKTSELRIEVDLVAEMAVFNPFDFFLEPHAEKFPFEYAASEQAGLAPYLVKLPATSGFADYLASIPRQPTRTIDFLVDINARLARDVRYLIRMEPGVQTPHETLANGSGSCRDSGWLLVQLLRHLGLAARFVSGYLIQLTADVKSLDGPSGPSADFTDLHAWCEVYLPGAGWIGLDPTSGLLAGEGHIPLACTAEPGSAAPVTGAVENCKAEFVHTMKVERVWEAPRVTKPYTEQQWSEIERLGHAIDADLATDDVRLTMGGEPTFVALDDPDSAEWNTAALGPNKRRLAAQLYHRLREQYAPQGLMHFGQGKWYPGEPLPRWSLNCFWRRDGEPIWQDDSLIADEQTDYSATDATAQRFLVEVAAQLGLHGEFVFAAYEDDFYYQWRLRRLPPNVDTFDSRLEDAGEAQRLARLFEKGLAQAAGYVLPLSRDAVSARWQSGRWSLRRERCYLLPGDSPIGYRLPLDSLPWIAPEDYPRINPPDPTQQFPPLPPHGAARAPLSSVKMTPKPATDESAVAITRTAMCAEPRNGVLHVFMPPTESLEDYLELVAAVEGAARALSQPVILEGYEPPRDPRLVGLRVTPDPGVIEVNIHPAASWSELVDHTTHLYEAARLARLTTEKFMLDGRHTGTGGGNHVVLGGATPGDSPFLRRPDLLRSLVAYWHNHPSLSYLFAGLFIGPTSQAPRTDEARNDSLYELEIAFQQVPPPGTEVAPWIVDRLFRNLLIDVTGNTHRAEFCIDKLYSPDGPTGRLGLLEMRAFEMPPHARMSLTQQLLLRSLVARFWRTPYEPARLARWGTQLHDRFMLPYFIEQDFADVLAEQQRAGFTLQSAWFAPHLEFRFPKYGDFALAATEVELRQALEPWHVMGEQGASGNTVRYVDSSVERLQVKVAGLAPDRYVLACNGRRVPLQPTGTEGEFVGGVRYRAWQPSAALHPTIGVHAPLTFDLVDTWMQRSMGGCQYHVMHPGGRNYATFPVNAFESESRRLGRFFRMGHTPGVIAPPAGAGESRPSLHARSQKAVNREVPNATLASYAVDAQRYDELLDATGAVRPHWRGLIDRLAAPDARETPRRGIELTRRLIIENGVTYNVYADPQGADRPWALDPLPLMLSAEEWRAIEEGVSQRARVLDALLADLYGPQRLLAEGVIPPELPFGHPNFLWPCHGIGPGNGIRLHIYAADLARAPDGRWWVLADRTQAPSGAGYALENREIVEQVLPQPIRDLGVRRVRGFFSELRASMLSHADAGESPLAVILTPGPFNETYFEHAYLSRQLGLPLVEGRTSACVATPYI